MSLDVSILLERAGELRQVKAWTSIYPSRPHSPSTTFGLAPDIRHAVMVSVARIPVHFLFSLSSFDAGSNFMSGTHTCVTRRNVAAPAPSLYTVRHNKSHPRYRKCAALPSPSKRCLRGLAYREMTSGRSAHLAQSKFELI